MTKEELDKTLEGLRQKYKTADPIFRKSYTQLANHAKWLYKKDSGILPPTQLTLSS